MHIKFCENHSALGPEDLPRDDSCMIAGLTRQHMIKLHEIKSLTALALPLMAAFLAQKSMQFIDTFMMGWIGPEALAAGAIATSIYFTLLVFCMGTLSAVGIFIVRAKGADDIRDIKSSMLHGLCLALFLSLPFMLMIWFAPYFLIVIGYDLTVVNNAILLLHGLVWGFLDFYCLWSCLSAAFH